jgi:MFS family permease
VSDATTAEGEREAVLETDRLPWKLVPATSVARRFSLQRLVASTFLSDGAREAVRYGALVAVVAAGGSAFRSALLGAIALLPPTLLGLPAGALADRLPRRSALVIVYAMQAAACVALPVFWGTSFFGVAALIFVINVLGQVSGPVEQCIAPLVASKDQLAAANSILGLSSSAGVLAGAGLLAPVFVVSFGVTPLFVFSGAMLLLAANRVWAVRPVAGSVAASASSQSPQRQAPATGLVSFVRWFASEPPISTMVTLGVLVGVADVIIEVLAPKYVAEVVGVAPEKAVYVFAPSVIGLVMALGVAPFAIRVAGERRCAALGLMLTTVALLLLGFVGAHLVVLVDPINPIRLLEPVGLRLNANLRTAALLAAPVGFGVSLTTTAVQTYINRRVPEDSQARTFAIESTLKNAAAIIPLLCNCALASVGGVTAVLAVSPVFLLGVGVCLVRLGGAVDSSSGDGSPTLAEALWSAEDDAASAAG